MDNIEFAEEYLRRTGEPGAKVVIRELIEELKAVKAERDQAYRKGMLRAAEIAENHIERIKYTSHRDGLGMGSMCCEKEVNFAAILIRKAIEEEASK